ncbi:MAG: undecaprenyl/decaprenyl-phosphate alpha-N-acetylglucosaminyl 1-phosphate transferase [Planctomycetes bacterium]|nr:undecaprenyl/decaprenyl-phosphate alpha-N-acetylglucosaminyl 1-phosphate transferase [Planctomycetota bacterium]
MVLTILAALLGSFILSVVGTFTIRALARRRGFVDRPGGHKEHDAPIALGGGIAITWAVCLPVMIATVAACAAVRFGVPDWCPELIKTHIGGVAFKAPAVFAIIGGALILHVVGLIDDARPLGAAPKFIAQFAVALILSTMFGIRVMELLPTWISVSITVLWIVLITNAFNFLDNVDGLSAGVAAIAGTIFAVSALSGGQIFVPVAMLMLVGALLGFLIFNFPPATIFMGDAGSMVVGYLMAVFIILTTFYDPDTALKPAGIFLPIVVLAVPLYDVVTVSIHRIRAGASIFRGDRRHFSHRLIQRGFSQRAAVLTIYLATAATSLAGIVLPHCDWPAACLIFAQCLCVVLLIAILEHTPGLRPKVES